MKNKTLLLLTLFCCAAFHHPSTAQDISGDWHGTLSMQGMQFRIHLAVSPKGEAYAATWHSPDYPSEPFPVAGMRFSESQVEFEVPNWDMLFAGSVNAEATLLSGALEARGEKYPLAFDRQPKEAPPGSLGWCKERLTKKEVYIPMRDGVRLFTSIYTPLDTSKTYPVLFLRTPYNIEGGGENEFTYHLLWCKQLVEEGYIFAYQDVRGRYMSEGEFVDVRPHNPHKKSNKDIDENSDTYDAIDWLVKNVRHNNGNVGIFGISYPGFYSTMSLPDAHPALKAVSPQAPVANWFIGDDFHHNGAFFLMDAFNFYSSFGKPRPKPVRQGQPGFDFPNEDNYEFFLELGALKNVKEKYFGDSIQFWNDLMSHPDYDDFWKARDVRPHLKNIRPAVLTVGGWFDAEDCWGALHTYEAIEKQNPPSGSNRLLMGPWSHGQWTDPEGKSLGNLHWGSNTGEHYHSAELQFFNYYLKNKGNLTLPEASIFVTGENAWRSFDNWPPAKAVEKTLYFQPGGGLSFQAPTTTAASFDEYQSDPMKPVPYTEDVHLSRTVAYMCDDQRFAARRPDVMVYETPLLTEDLTLTGPLTAQLFVSTTGTDADYVVKLIDVFPDSLSVYPENEKGVPMAGYQMLVRGEIFRGRYRNSFEKPEPFQPNSVTEVKFELPAVAHTFKKGHRIMVQVQNSWFPLADRNPQQFVDIYHCTEADFRKATHRMFHDRSHASCLRVLVLGE